MIIIKCSEYPTAKPGKVTSFEVLQKKAACFQLQLFRPEFTVRNLDKLGYQCKRCDGIKDAKISTVSNEIMNKEFNRAKIADKYGYKILPFLCPQCRQHFHITNPSLGRNQYGDRLTYDDLAPRFKRNGFTLSPALKEIQKYLKVSKKYLCTCDCCGNQQEQSAEDMAARRAILCRTCKTNKFSEGRIRSVLEALYKKPFETRRNLFTKKEIKDAYITLNKTINENTKKQRKYPAWLEIDMYCKSENIALEHNGDQHIRKSKSGFITSDAELSDLQARDCVKTYLASQKNINLITVNQLKDPSLEGVRKHIEIPLMNAGFKFSDEQWHDIDIPTFDNQYSKSIIDFINQKRYTVITPPPYTQSSIIQYTCDKGHKCKTSAGSLKSGCGCIACAQKKPWSELAITSSFHLLGYKTISPLDNIRANSKIRIACLECGHDIFWHEKIITYRRRVLNTYFTVNPDDSVDFISPKRPGDRPPCQFCIWIQQFIRFASFKRGKIKLDSSLQDWRKLNRSRQLGEYRQRLLKFVSDEDWEAVDFEMKRKLKSLEIIDRTT